MSTETNSIEHASGIDELVVITGMSGAGRTEAMHIFEDLNYFCIDNLPPKLLMSLVTSDNLMVQGSPAHKIAVVCDARTPDYFQQLTNELAKLRAMGLEYRIVFLDASDQSLLARYKASRRRHPLCTDSKMTIAQGIQREREVLTELRAASNVLLDTTNMKPMALRQKLNELFSKHRPQTGLGVVVYSFGFKHGAALDADIVIDVRFLPNPYYDSELRHLTGLDEPVRSFVVGRPQTKEFLLAWHDLLACIMPGYVAEGKQQLAVAVGCTGGQHRSVVLAEETGSYLKELGYRTHVTHRDLSHADTRSREGKGA